jgi:UDP-N-acetylglucosamine/UDP-N-acetylgalactosamine diphosphorylase
MAAVLTNVPDDLRKKLQQHRQEHVLAWWERLGDEERRDLIEQLRAIDLDGLNKLYAERERTYRPPDSSHIKPIPVVPSEAPDNAAMRAAAEEALRRGEVAALIVAGGQGSRLGFEHPKGMYPVGPVSRKSLFQIHAEKVLALGRCYGKQPPLLVMTSPATDAETREFFAEKNYFGLPREEVFLFCQGTMPALDLATGRLLLESPGRLFLSPDGHGGTLTALARSGLLERLQKRGIRHLFYFQVDNPLVKVADPIFLGRHLSTRSEASSKIVPKQGPKDRLGNLVLVEGRCTMIEYSDLPDSLAHERDETGRLRLWVGSPAIHLFDLDFLARLTEGAGKLPFHIRDGTGRGAGQGERPQVRAVHLRCAAAGRALAGGGNVAPRGVRSAQERGGGRFAADGRGGTDQPRRRLAGTGRRPCAAHHRGRAGVCAGGQPAVRPGRRGVGGESGSRHENQWANVSWLATLRRGVMKRF